MPSSLSAPAEFQREPVVRAFGGVSSFRCSPLLFYGCLTRPCFIAGLRVCGFAGLRVFGFAGFRVFGWLLFLGHRHGLAAVFANLSEPNQLC